MFPVKRIDGNRRTSNGGGELRRRRRELSRGTKRRAVACDDDMSGPDGGRAAHRGETARTVCASRETAQYLPSACDYGNRRRTAVIDKRRFRRYVLSRSANGGDSRVSGWRRYSCTGASTTKRHRPRRPYCESTRRRRRRVNVCDACGRARVTSGAHRDAVSRHIRP